MAPTIEEVFVQYLTDAGINARASADPQDLGPGPVVIVGTDELVHDAGNLYTANLRITVSTEAAPGEAGAELKNDHQAVWAATVAALEATTENREAVALVGEAVDLGIGGWWTGPQRTFQGADRWEATLELVVGVLLN
jgi:hypothetical protein